MEDIWQEDDGWYYISEPLVSKTGPFKTKQQACANACAATFEYYTEYTNSDFTNFIRMLTIANESFEFNPSRNQLIVSINSTALFFSSDTGDLLCIGD